MDRKRVIYVISILVLMLVIIILCRSNYGKLSEKESISIGEGDDNTKRMSGEVTLSDKMTVMLPDGMTAGEFDEFLGAGGGMPLYNSEGQVCGTIEIQYSLEGIYKDGVLTGVKLFDNHSSFETEFEQVDSLMPGVAVKYGRDAYDEHYKYVGNEYFWYAFWAKDNHYSGYAIKLKVGYATYEELIAIAETVTFSEDAFMERKENSSEFSENYGGA